MTLRLTSATLVSEKLPIILHVDNKYAQISETAERNSSLMLISHTFCGTESKTSGARPDGRNDVIVYVSRIGTNGDCSQKAGIYSSDGRSRGSCGMDEASVSDNWGSGHDWVTKSMHIPWKWWTMRKCVPCITGMRNVTRMKRDSRVNDLFASGPL